MQLNWLTVHIAARLTSFIYSPRRLCIRGIDLWYILFVICMFYMIQVFFAFSFLIYFFMKIYLYVSVFLYILFLICLSTFLNRATCRRKCYECSCFLLLKQKREVHLNKLWRNPLPAFFRIVSLLWKHNRKYTNLNSEASYLCLKF